MNRRLLSLFILLLSCTVCRAGGDYSFNYQAKLTDSNGAPLTGSHNFYFWVFAGGTAGDIESGTPIYAESAILTATDGVVNHAVGSQFPSLGTFSPALFSVGGTYFLQVAVDQDTNTIVPRTPIKSVPMALKAANAASADSVPWSGITLPPADLVDGASVANIVTVAKSGAQFTSVQAAINSINDATSATPYLVKVAPGIYLESVVMKPYVDIAGSGDNNTTITVTPDIPGNPITLIGAADCELRDISISHAYTGSGTHVAIYTDQSMRFRNLTVTVINPASTDANGIAIQPDARVSLKNVTIIVSTGVTGVRFGTGLLLNGHAEIDGLYCQTNSYDSVAIYGTNTSSTVTVRNSRILATGDIVVACLLYGEIIQLENSTLIANATGVATGHKQFEGTAILRNSVIAGATITVAAAGSSIVRLTGCTLEGGAVTIGPEATLTCTNCQDEDFIPNIFPNCP